MKKNKVDCPVCASTFPCKELDAAQAEFLSEKEALFGLLDEHVLEVIEEYKQKIWEEDMD